MPKAFRRLLSKSCPKLAQAALSTLCGCCGLFAAKHLYIVLMLASYVSQSPFPPIRLSHYPASLIALFARSELRILRTTITLSDHAEGSTSEGQRRGPTLDQTEEQTEVATSGRCQRLSRSGSKCEHAASNCSRYSPDCDTHVVQASRLPSIPGKSLPERLRSSRASPCDSVRKMCITYCFHSLADVTRRSIACIYEGCSKRVRQKAALRDHIRAHQ